MDFLKRNIQKTLRNGNQIVTKLVSTSAGVGTSSSLSGNYLPATSNGDGTYTVDLTKVTFNGHIEATGEVSAYGAGSGTTPSGGSVTIIDNLTSTDANAALSANQGRALKELIDNIDVSGIDLSGYYSKSEIDTLLANHTGNTTVHITATERTNWNDANSKKHTHTNKTVLDNLTQSVIDNSHTHSNKSVLDGITSTKVSNWDSAATNKHTHSNKSVLDGITSTKVSNWDSVYTNWNNAFYFDNSGNLKAKVNLIGEMEVSAYGAGESGSGGIVTIVDNLTSTATDAALSANMGRHLKSLIDNIDVSQLDTSNFVTLNTEQTISGAKTFSKEVVSDSYFKGTSYTAKFSTDTSQCRGLGWQNTSGTTVASINYHNTAQNIILNPIGSSNVWTDAVGKYSLFVGNNKLTYNTYPILTSNNVGTYAVTLDTTQTITGVKTFNSVIKLNGYGIEDVSGNGLLVYRPAGSWGGISNTQWGLGSVDSQGVIRSSNTDLIHYKGGTNTTIFDSSNYRTYTDGRYFPIGTGAGTVINSNENLNDKLSTGAYICQSGSVAGTLSNTPYTAGNFKLLYIGNTGTNGAASSNYGSQLIIAGNEARWFTRSHSNNAFGDWKEFAYLTGNPSSMQFNGNSKGIRCYNGSVEMHFYIGSGGTNRGIWDSTANAWTIYVNSAKNTVLNVGNVGIGVTSPSQKLHVSGNILATGEVTAYSDIRLKKNIKPLTPRGTLKPVTYEKDGKQSIGFIAQDVQKIYPELVTEEKTDEKYLSLNYAQLTAVLYAEILELKAEIKQLKDKIK